MTAEERTEQMTNTDLPGSNGLPANGLPAGLVTMCIGGGQGIAAIFERL